MTTKGRVTLPIEIGIEETVKDIIELWGADAIRNSDGTVLSDYFKNLDLKVYSTYFPTRADQKWPRENIDQLQQMYLISERVTAKSEIIEIEPLKIYFSEQFQISGRKEDNPHIWWEVINRTTGEIVNTENWDYSYETKKVTIRNAKKWNIYTVNFLAQQKWDTTQMYNYLTNDWNGLKEMPYDPAYEKTKNHILDHLDKWANDNKAIDVVRFTTFFYHFTIMYNQHAQQMFGDWFGYSASISTEALKNFEKEFGYKLRSEDIVDNGYYNNAFRNPTKEFLDFIEYQQRFVCGLAKVCVDIVHKYGKEAIMFVGDNWIGMEPYGEHFPSVGLDGVAGSSGSGLDIRMVSDMPGVRIKEIRFLPYFFPDTFNDHGGDPVGDMEMIWQKARRALLVKKVDRIGYGGYLSLANKFPKFITLVEDICNQFRSIHDEVDGEESKCSNIKVAVLNTWGKIKSWQCNRTGHVGGRKEVKSYQGVLECLSGLPFDIDFINFNDIKKDGFIDKYSVIINMGTEGTSWSGGNNWLDEKVVSTIREWVDKGNGFIGIGDPTACEFGGTFFQLSDVLGVTKEKENTLQFTKRDKINIENHYITNDFKNINLEVGFASRNIYSTNENLEILDFDINDGVKLSGNTFGEGRGVYISGLPYTIENARVLQKAIIWASTKEEDMYLTTNINTEVYFYENSKKIAVINNSKEKQVTKIVYKNKEIKEVELEAYEMQWHLV